MIKEKSWKKEKRFGQIAVDKGFITPEQLLYAMKIQILEDIDNKPHRNIGSILFELGYISEKEINEVLDELFKNE